MMEVVGGEPDPVTAFGVIGDRHRQFEQVIINEALMKFDAINCHPLANTATTAIARNDLLAFMRDCG
ncbi:MAG: hypothetical protein AAFR90_00715 [Pseudomonadota bacterium]